MKTTPEVKECIRRLFSHFERVKRQRYPHYSNIFKQVSVALGVNLSTVYKAVNKASKQQQIKINCELSFIRNTVHCAYRAGKCLSLRKLQKLLEKKGMVTTLSSLRQYTKILGFKFYAEKNRRFITETPHIVSLRHSYLREIRKLRKGGFDTVYIDEMWITAHHTNHRVRTENGKGPTSGTLHEDADSQGAIWSGNGNKLIILDAGSPRRGFIPDVALVFQSKSEDYPNKMNQEVFIEWFEETLIPALKEPSVIIMDDAPYHNVKTLDSWYPEQSSGKTEIKEWLQKNSIKFEDCELKSELLKKVAANKPVQVYSTDRIAVHHGHKVLRLPPKHYELNPMELIQGEEKNYIARENSTFKMPDVKNLFKLAKERITRSMWEKATNYVIENIEDKFWRTDCIIDDVTPVVVPVDDAGDSDDAMEDEESVSMEDEETVCPVCDRQEPKVTCVDIKWVCCDLCNDWIHEQCDEKCGTDSDYYCPTCSDIVEEPAISFEL